MVCSTSKNEHKKMSNHLNVTNQVTMRRAKIKNGHTKNGYGKREFFFANLYEDVSCVCGFFLVCFWRGNSPETRKLYAIRFMCNIWSFAACVNHVCNHKSHAIWMHKTEESGLSFRCFTAHSTHSLTHSTMVLLPHIFNFDYIIYFFHATRFWISFFVILRARTCMFVEMINCDSLPATCNVAFRLRTDPNWLRASHQ